MIGLALILVTVAGNIAPSQNAWIQAFGLIYPILFIVNLAFLVYWALIKSRYAAIPIIVILFGFNNVFDNFQITFFNSDEKLESETKIISYNVHNFGEQKKDDKSANTKQEIISFLLDQDADIVCLQEYHSSSNKLYEPLKEIRDTLGAQSYYYESYFNPRYNQLSGLVIFSKYKAVNKGKLKFTGSRSFGIFTDVIIDGDTVRVFNIHLASIELQPEDLDFVVNPEVENSERFRSQIHEIYNKLMQAFKLREKQLEHIIIELEICRYPIILGGDFNDTPSSWVYDQLTDYLDDTYIKKGSGISRTYAGPLPLLRIDYILISDIFKTKNFTRHSLDKSDHYPISAILKSR